MSSKRKAYYYYYYLIGLFFFINSPSFSQNQKIADSLAIIYENNDLVGIEKLELFRELAFNEVNDLELSLKYAEDLISHSINEGNNRFLFHGHLQKGNIHKLQGNLEMALGAFFKSGEAAIIEKYISGEGSAYISIADVYSEMGNSDNAETYYNKGIQILRRTEDYVSLANALLNAGDEAFNNNDYSKALNYFKESGILYKKENYLTGTAYNKGNIGMVYAEQGKDELAEANINEAIKILEKQEDYYPISVYLTYMSDIYLRKKEYTKALGYAKRSLELATHYGLKDQISESNLKLSELYEEMGDLPTSYKYYKEHIIYRDSVINLKNVQEAADTRTNFEVSQKQIEVDLLDQRRKNQQLIAIAIASTLFLLAFGLYRRNKFVNKTKKIIETERDRSDTLLLNILPEETANELKETGAVKAKKYDAATVLFTDFIGFTSYSEKLSPEALVETVSFYFSKFDAIIEKHGLEKIKTIGDAYMCAGGLHDNTEDHASRMIKAAFEIADFVEETKKDKAASELAFDIRIGINTGPVVAGVVGTKKFAYDIWGDTVNVASRMESMSEPGKINISQSTYELIKDDVVCEYRGEIEAKNRGKVKMYFATAIKEQVAAMPSG